MTAYKAEYLGTIQVTTRDGVRDVELWRHPFNSNVFGTSAGPGEPVAATLELTRDDKQCSPPPDCNVCGRAPGSREPPGDEPLGPLDKCPLCLRWACPDCLHEAHCCCFEGNDPDGPAPYGWRRRETPDGPELVRDPQVLSNRPYYATLHVPMHLVAGVRMALLDWVNGNLYGMSFASRRDVEELTQALSEAYERNTVRAAIEPRRSLFGEGGEG